MPTRYLSTFTTGFSDVIVTTLIKNIKDATIELLLDGLVVFRSNTSINQVRQLRFFTNTFIVLIQKQSVSSDPLLDILNDALQLRNTGPLLASLLPHRPTTFRLRTFNQNQPVSIDPQLISQIEKKLSQLPFFHLDKSRAKYEFWGFTRSEGLSFFALKVTNHLNYEKSLSKGELQPELAHLLCLLSQPRAKETFLDPFAGYGSIPLERTFILPPAQIIAGDHNPELVDKLAKRAKTNHKSIVVKQLDARHLSFTSNSVNKIVTDPPWGMHEKSLNVEQLYLQMMSEFQRVLTPKGIVVILTAQKEMLENYLNHQSGWQKLAIYSTLVSGQKASVFVAKKI